MASGKAERFIKTALEEWAYARAFQTSGERIQRLGRSKDNLLRLHS